MTAMAIQSIFLKFVCQSDVVVKNSMRYQNSHLAVGLVVAMVFKCSEKVFRIMFSHGLGNLCAMSDLSLQFYVLLIRVCALQNCIFSSYYVHNRLFIGVILCKKIISFFCLHNSCIQNLNITIYMPGAWNIGHKYL